MSSLEPIKCRAAVMYDYQKPLTLEDVIIDAPKDDQVRVKLVSASVCLSDVITLEGKFKLSGQQLPIVSGHEGAGIVESVGENVTSVKPGDHVLVTYVTRCNNCNYCSSSLKPNFCAKQNVFLLGMIPNKKLAQTGKPLQSSAALGTFCEYILVKDCQVDKIDKLIKLDNLSPITCTAANAFGASRNIANVVPGSSVAVWGSCAFGLNTMFGAKLNGAKNIIAIDMHNDRKRLAQEFGCTEFINPEELDKPVCEYLLEKYGGVDYAFDCNGEPSNVPDSNC